MRSLYISLCIVTLGVVLILSGCGSSTTTTTSVVYTPAKPIVTATPTALPPTSTPTAVPQPDPARLIIPTIGINATIERVGVLSNSDLATPVKSPWVDVGWYELGSRPGARGSAVIDGHLDRPGGYPAVFWNLRNLQPGDQVIVIDTLGRKEVFRVTRLVFYAPQDAPIQDIFGNDNGSFLNLITCAGDWIPSQHQTTLRLVVYTTLVQ